MTPYNFRQEVNRIRISIIKKMILILLYMIIILIQQTQDAEPMLIQCWPICICMLRGSTHYCAIAPRALSRHIVDFLGSGWMETASSSIEVFLRPTLGQSDEPSDLRGSLSPTTRHRCTHVLVYTAPGSPSPSLTI